MRATINRTFERAIFVCSLYQLVEEIMRHDRADDESSSSPPGWRMEVPEVLELEARGDRERRSREARLTCIVRGQSRHD
jgi:hypothetical protein